MDENLKLFQIFKLTSIQDKGKPLAFIPCLKPKCGWLRKPHFQGFSAFFLIKKAWRFTKPIYTKCLP